jgi:hypothetical protein
MGPPTAMEVASSGNGNGGSEAEVMAAFAEINEDLRDKQDILDKCECSACRCKRGCPRPRPRPRPHPQSTQPNTQQANRC